MFGGIVVSSGTSQFLDNLSAKLAVINQSIAVNIINGRAFTSGTRAEIDRSLVRLEQGQVQAELNAFKARDAKGFESVIDEINGLLIAGGVNKIAGDIFDPNFQNAIDSVRDQLGRNIDFANENDRIAIGDELTKRARRAGLCDRPDSKLRRC